MPTQYPLIELTRDQKNALKGTTGNPSEVNRFVTSTDPILSHGIQGGGNLHSLATISSAGFMSAEDKQILADFAVGAIESDRFKILSTTLTTTSTTNQLYDSWTTSNIDAGTYLIRWMFKLRTQTYQTPGEFSLRLDGTTIMSCTMAAAYNETEAIGAVDIAQITFGTDASHVIAIYLRRAGGSNNTRVHLLNSYVEIIKVP